MKQYYQKFWPTLLLIFVSFFADIFMSVIAYQHIIHASCITLCLLLWTNASAPLRIISGFLTVMSYFFDGLSCSLELLSIMIPIIVILGLRSVLTDSVWVKVLIILMVLKLKTFMTGTSFLWSGPWTGVGIIANIIIIVLILKCMRDRRAIA